MQKEILLEQRELQQPNSKYISDWLEINSKNNLPTSVGHIASVGNDFQNQRMIFVDNEEKIN
jgi:hypothetical protein